MWTTLPVIQSKNSKLQPDNPWSQTPLSPTFATGRVDVWKVRLDEPDIVGSEPKVLSADEIGRANRFHFEKDRIHFTRCRSALRGLLARYVAIPPAEIDFEYLTGGKPQLATGKNPGSLQFNVSHSAGIALIAVSAHRLGVDVERIRNDVDTDSLSERFFSARERAGLQSLPVRLQVPGFYACWTRKEAFLKATGDGLSFPLTDFSVSTHPDLDPELEEIRGNTGVGKQWRLFDLNVVDGYRATVAAEATSYRIETYLWN